MHQCITRFANATEQTYSSNRRAISSEGGEERETDWIERPIAAYNREVL